MTVRNIFEQSYVCLFLKRIVKNQASSLETLPVFQYSSSFVTLLIRETI